MGLPSSEWCRRLHLVIAIMAAIGLEFDVLCNPFAPTVILHWLTSFVDSPENQVNDSLPSATAGIADARAVSDETSESSDQSGPTRVPSRFSVTPEIAEAIAVRPRPRLSCFVVDIEIVSMFAPWLKPSIEGRERRRLHHLRAFRPGEALPIPLLKTSRQNLKSLNWVVAAIFPDVPNEPVCDRTITRADSPMSGQERLRSYFAREAGECMVFVELIGPAVGRCRMSHQALGRAIARHGGRPCLSIQVRGA